MKTKILITAAIVAGVLFFVYFMDAKRIKFKVVSKVIEETKTKKVSKDNFVQEKFPDRNLLSQEKSPYLLQHANNPVWWYPWGDEAFAKAKAEDKSVFLPKGYSTSH